MQIRVGFEMIYDCPQPTPMILNLNVHFTRVSDLVGRDDLVFDPPVPMAAYRDSFGNWCTRIVAPKGRTRVSADAIVNDTGAPDVIVPRGATASRAGPARGNAALPARKPVLRNRPAVRDGVESLRAGADRMGPRPGDLRLCPSPHHLRLRARAHDADGARSLSRQDRRLPRLCAPRRRLLPVHEHPRALLHRLPGRHRRAAAARPDGFRRVVRGLPRRPLVHVRRAQQHAAHRPGADRARPRRVRRRDQQHVRPQHAGRASRYGPTRYAPVESIGAPSDHAFKRRSPPVRRPLPATVRRHRRGPGPWDRSSGCAREARDAASKAVRRQ